MAATRILSDSIPSSFTKSCRIGCRPFAHKRRTRSSVSSPDNVVKSMHVIARRSHATCQSFFTVRRVTRVCARRSTALVLTRIFSIQSKFSGMPRFGCSSRPASAANALSPDKRRSPASAVIFAAFPSLGSFVTDIRFSDCSAKYEISWSSRFSKCTLLPGSRLNPTSPLVTNPPKRRIKLRILLVSPIQQIHVLRERFHALRHMHRRLTCLVHGGPDVSAHPREQRRPVRSSFLRCNQVHRHSVDVRLYLLPQRATRPAAAEAYRFHWYTQIPKNRERVAQTKRHAFQNRPNHMRTRVLRREPHQSATRVRVEMRRSLSHQIWRPKQTIRTRRGCRSLFHQHIVRSAAAELIPKPSQREARALRNAHDMPTTRNRVAKCMNPSFRLDHWKARRREHDA